MQQAFDKWDVDNLLRGKGHEFCHRAETRRKSSATGAQLRSTKNRRWHCPRCHVWDLGLESGVCRNYLLIRFTVSNFLALSDQTKPKH